MITPETQVEDLVKYPNMIDYLIRHGVSPITCDGAFPQTLGRLLEVKKVTDPAGFIAEINAFLAEQEQRKATD